LPSRCACFRKPPLIAALNRFPDLYQQAMARRWCWRLGVEPRGLEEDSALIGACEAAMVAQGIGPDAFFFAHRGGRGPFADDDAGAALKEALGLPVDGRRSPLLDRRSPAIDADRRSGSDLGTDRRKG
jgi:hypothetical protein